MAAMSKPVLQVVRGFELGACQSQMPDTPWGKASKSYTKLTILAVPISNATAGIASLLAENGV